ncbi:MAG: hypothetical protein QXH56_01120 [Thermoprotei archaeon]
MWRTKWVGLLRVVGTGLIGVWISARIVAHFFAPEFSYNTLYFVAAFISEAVVGSVLGILVLQVSTLRRGVTWVWATRSLRS